MPPSPACGRGVGGEGDKTATLFFGDALLPWLGHIAFLLLESIEEALDVLFESVFALTPRSAQMVVAWVGMVLFVYGAFKAIQKIHHFIQYELHELTAIFSRWHEQFESSSWTAWLNHPWAKPMIGVIVVGVALLMFV